VPAELRVECVAAMHGPHFAPPPHDDPLQPPEDGLSERNRSAFRRHVRSALLFAIFVAFCIPFAKGQQPAPADNTTAASSSTPVQVPDAAQANHGAKDWLRLAQQQGTADSTLLDWVLANSGSFKGDIRAGELRVAFTITPAEGWWDKAGVGKLAWHEAPAGNMHLRVFVADLSDGRLMPGLSLRATLTDAFGNEQSAPVDFGWYPLINAYGGNIPIDADSSYILRVTVDPLPSSRVPDRFSHLTVAEFPPVQISREALATLPLATATGSANEAELLKPCNAALTTAITTLWQRSVTGAEKPFGDYFVGYALGYALDNSAPTTSVSGAELHIKNLMDLNGKSTARVIVFPRDSRTGRLIPGLKPQASLIAPNGKLYGPGELALAWHPWFNHYGRRVRIPRNDVYKLRVHFEAPGFRRWGRQSDRFSVPVDVEFDDVSLKAERKSNP